MLLRSWYYVYCYHVIHGRIKCNRTIIRLYVFVRNIDKAKKDKSFTRLKMTVSIYFNIPSATKKI